MVVRKKETAISAIGSMFGDRKTNNAIGSGLGVKVTRLSAGLASHVDGLRYCHKVPTRARIAVPTRVSGSGLGGLHSTRRLIATSRYARGFSFGISRNGIIAPVPNYGLMSHGKPSGLSLPCGRSANPCGVSHLLGGWWVISDKLTQGIKAMMLTLSSSVSTAFPSVPEPIYKPVTSSTGNASNNDVKKGGSFDALNTPSCSATASRAILSATIRKNGCRRGNLPVSSRRSIAASCFARGVSFGGSRNHGIIAPSLFVGAFRPKFLTGSRTGGFQAYRFLERGISTPYGLPSPWKGRVVLKNVLGASVMMRTLTRGVSTTFISTPEPIYKPVTSSTGSASNNDVKKGGSFDALNTPSCSATPSRAMLSATIRKNGCRRGNLPVSTRRHIAASCFARGVSFGGSRNHGVIASAFRGAVYPQFLMGSRAGGCQAYRFLVRGISTPHGLPSPWKGRAVLQSVPGKCVMMRTLTRSVSTTFIPTPEPVFKPVTSATTGSSEPVSYDVTSDVNAIVELLVNEYNSTINDSSVYGRFRFNVVRGVAVEILRACDEALGRVYTPSKVIGG